MNSLIKTNRIVINSNRNISSILVNSSISINSGVSSSSSSSKFYSTIINGGKDEEPIKKSIVEKLTSQFTPNHLEVINESYMHSVPRGSETHFKVIIVSKEFENKNMVSQHRLVNQALKDEFKKGVHALSIHSTTPSKWELDQSINKSPGCMGGSKKEKSNKSTN